MEKDLLGKQILPLPINRNLISGREADKRNGGMGAWITGDKAINHYKKAVDFEKSEYDEDSINQKWYVFAICADETYTLRSEMGYERAGVDRDEFEEILNGDTWDS